MGMECARYPVTETAKKIYMKWGNDISRPDILSRIAERGIRTSPHKMASLARAINGVSYGFVGIRPTTQKTVRNFCSSQGISITKFLSGVIEYSAAQGWRIADCQR